MAEEKPSIGVAIDQILAVLHNVDSDNQRDILRFVIDHLKIAVSYDASTPRENNLAQLPPDPGLDVRMPAKSPIPQNIDIRGLKDQKHPSSARQMACVVAFYLQELAPDEEKKDAISVKDAENYFKQAGYKLPSKLEQLLIDCKGAGYFQSVGRGEYKLTRVGYNLVAHSMPSKGSE